MITLAQTDVLIVEDGDEYLLSLQPLTGGPRWTQAKNATQAKALLATANYAGVVLDMRFDRSPRGDLVGDLQQVTRELGGDPERAYKHLAQHQGLYILAELRAQGWQGPALIAYDFSRELRRFEMLRQLHGPLDWIGDDATTATWLSKLAQWLQN